MSSFTINAFVDIQQIAGVARRLKDTNNLNQLGNYSEVVRRAIEVLDANLPEDERFQSVTEAITWLRQNGYKISQANESKALKPMQKEAILAEISDSTGSKPDEKSVDDILKLMETADGKQKKPLKKH